MRAACLLLALPLAATGPDATRPAATPAPTPTAPVPSGFHRPGNILIADRRNNRVIEVGPGGDIVWQFGGGRIDPAGDSPIGPRSVERRGDLTLVTAAGFLPGEIAACPEGCRDDRVLIVDPAGKVVWQYGRKGASGSGGGELDRPAGAAFLPSGNVLIADRGNHRVIEVERGSKRVAWQHGKTGEPGSGADRLRDPGSARPMDDALVLIADSGNDRAIVVDREHRVIATYTAGGTAKDVTTASVAADTGNILIVEQGHKRVAELDPADKAIWSKWTYVAPGSVADPKPACVLRLRSGDTLICDQLNHRVLRVDPMAAEVAVYGNIARPGMGSRSAGEGLDAPTDVDVVGE